MPDTRVPPFRTQIVGGGDRLHDGRAAEMRSDSLVDRRGYSVPRLTGTGVSMTALEASTA